MLFSQSDGSKSLAVRRRRNLDDALEGAPHRVSAIAAWVFGISFAVAGRWFSQFWLAFKIPLALILSGLPGVLTGKLRRYASQADSYEPIGQLLLPIGFVLLTSIVLLVVLKM